MSLHTVPYAASKCMCFRVPCPFLQIFHLVLLTMLQGAQYSSSCCVMYSLYSRLLIEDFLAEELPWAVVQPLFSPVQVVIYIDNNHLV